MSERGVEEAARGKAGGPGPGVVHGAIIAPNMTPTVEISQWRHAWQRDQPRTMQNRTRTPLADTCGDKRRCSALNNVLHLRGLVRHNNRTKCEFLKETKEMAKLAHNARTPLSYK